MRGQGEVATSLSAPSEQDDERGAEGSAARGRSDEKAGSPERTRGWTGGQADVTAQLRSTGAGGPGRGGRAGGVGGAAAGSGAPHRCAAAVADPGRRAGAGGRCRGGL